MTSNLEGDKFFIDEFVDGLDKTELKKFKSAALELMKSQNVYDSVYSSVYRGVYKYIVCRRLYKKEIEAYTNKTILGDYISSATRRWVTLRG